jgi:hypothetical protein
MQNTTTPKWTPPPVNVDKIGGLFDPFKATVRGDRLHISVTGRFAIAPWGANVPLASVAYAKAVEYTNGIGLQVIGFDNTVIGEAKRLIANGWMISSIRAKTLVIVKWINDKTEPQRTAYDARIDAAHAAAQVEKAHRQEVERIERERRQEAEMVEQARRQIRVNRTAGQLEGVVSVTECPHCGAPPSPSGQVCRYCGTVAT